VSWRTIKVGGPDGGCLGGRCRVSDSSMTG
jgi:hypothetical protein